MKRRKKLWRVLKPILLVGAGLMVGIIIVESNSPSVAIHHDFNHSQLEFEHELEMELERLEIELEHMTADIEIPPIPEIPAIPDIPSISSNSDQVQPIIVTNHTYESFDNYHINLGEMVATVGGFGVAMLFLMGFILLVDEFRGRRTKS